MIGETVSHYKITEKIGEGGMGQVFLAEDIELHRRAVLKFLPKDYASDTDALLRFKREAQAAAALNHPNIITIYDTGEYKGRPYIVMEYVEGETLASVIAKKNLTIDRTLEIAACICDAVSRAHAASIIHRDIKPDNIILARDGRPKILDFGLAKLRGVDKLTQESSTVGTAGYMSPEQARGDDVDNRSDIFSLGAVIYEMITGRPPFTGEHTAAVLYAVAHEQLQPLKRYNNTVTEDLERIVGKALAKNREERYQDASDLLVDLRAAQNSLHKNAPPARPGRRARLPLLIVSAAVVLAAAWYFIRPAKQAPPAVDQKSIAVLPFQNMSADPENEYFSDGITEDILAQLSKIADLRVVSRTSVMQYKETDKSIHEIGRELGVATVLEGSVRREEGKVRIVAQLIDARTDEHIWAETYDRDLKEVFSIQSDVAERIAHALEARLTPEEAERIQIVPTDNMTAYDYYLKGRNRYHRYDRSGNEEAIVFFKKALELDPDYALAYAGLGDAYGQRAMRYGYDSAWADSSLLASEKAISIEPNLAEGYKALSLGYMYKGWLTKALEANIKSTDLDPNYIDAFGNVGWAYLMLGRPDEAMRWMKKVLLRNPNFGMANLGVGGVYLSVGEYEKARRWVRNGLNVLPDEPFAETMLASSYILQGRFDEARNRVSALTENNPDQWIFREEAVWLELLDGKLARARDMLQEYERRQWPDKDARSFIESYLGCTLRVLGEVEKSTPLLEKAATDLQNEIDQGDESYDLRERLVYIRAVEGKKDEALGWLERSFETGDLYSEVAEQNPFLDGLRDDKRFQVLIAEAKEKIAVMRKRIHEQEPLP